MTDRAAESPPHAIPGAQAEGLSGPCVAVALLLLRSASGFSWLSTASWCAMTGINPIEPVSAEDPAASGTVELARPDQDWPTISSMVRRWVVFSGHQHMVVAGHVPPANH